MEEKKVAKAAGIPGKKRSVSKRLHVYGKVLSFKRSKHHTSENTVLIQIDGLKIRKDCDFYLGKRVVYEYPIKKKGGKPTNGKIWGRITRPHGNSGVVRAKFAKNLPPSSFGNIVKVKLYPSRI